MKEINRKTFVVKYKYGSQWFEFHCKSREQVSRFLQRKQGDPRMGVAIVRTK